VSGRRSMMRVSLAVGVLAAGGLVWTGAVEAAGHDINVTGDAAKCDKTWGPPCFTPANGTVTAVAVGETVTWHVLDGTHTVTPVDPAAFTGSGDLSGPDATFPVTFDKPGVFTFYCKHHGQVDKDGKTFHGMWGKIEVKGSGESTTTSGPPATNPPPQGSPAPPPAKPDPGPPAPPQSNPPSSSQGGSAPPPSRGGSGNGETAAGTGRPWVGPPPPTQAPPPPRYASAPPPEPAPSEPAPRARDGRDSRDNYRDGGNGGGNGGNQAPSVPAVPPPDALVLPPSPAFPTPTTAPTNAPGGAPQGDAVAVLKSEAGAKHKKLILVGTMFGVGAFAVGVGGWKYTHRASKYWPA
jgi:plastocyanin